MLCVGYCAPTTLGAKIMRGDKKVSIFGRPVTVRADLRRIDAYSAHGDYEEMIQYISCQNKKKLKKIFLVHGEEETQENFKNTLKDRGFADVEIPSRLDSIEL